LGLIEGVLLLITILGFLLSFSTRKSGQTKYLSKPLIENIDSLASKAKPILSDTTKVLKTLK